MTTDVLAERVRSATQRIAVPPYPAALVAERIAATGAVPAASRAPATTRALVAGFIIVGALAAAVPNADRMSDAARRTYERLLGHRVGPSRTYMVQPISLDEARRHTTFPIIVPGGFTVSDARPWDKNQGITLMIKDPKLGVVMLAEHFAGTSMGPLEGIGIHDDGSIRRFNVRRWTIGRVAFSIAMYDAHYHDIAVRIERATRVAAAHDPRVFSAANR